MVEEENSAKDEELTAREANKDAECFRFFTVSFSLGRAFTEELWKTRHIRVVRGSCLVPFPFPALVFPISTVLGIFPTQCEGSIAPLPAAPGNRGSCPQKPRRQQWILFPRKLFIYSSGNNFANFRGNF